jgi:uncharacterized protein involved in exopolysaccharide biosynthesis
MDYRLSDPHQNGVSSDQNNQPESRESSGMGALPPGAYSPAYWYATQAPGQENEIDLLGLVQDLIARWKLIASITFSATLIATVVALVMPPVYRASALLSPVQQEAVKSGLSAVVGQLGGLAALSGISSLNPGSNVETTIATLQSRRFLLEFVHDNDLKPILFPERWDHADQAWLVEEPSFLRKMKDAILRTSPTPAPSEQLSPGEPTTNETYKLLKEEVINVEEDVKTGLVSLTVDWDDPVRAAQWANELVVRANDELRRRAIAESERSIAYLSEQAAQTSVADLRSLIYGLIEEYTKNMTVAKTQPEFALKVIDPAFPPDPKDKVRPKRGLIVVLGFLIGGFVGVLAALTRAGLERARAAGEHNANGLAK